MTRHLFFSWQMDTPRKVNRDFLREVLEEVCREIAADATVDEAARDVRVDSDTQGVAGQPPIAETILDKIDAAAVFVPDMTFTGKRLDGRPTPNPNVLLEYGWALKSLGHQRMLSVMNTAYGKPTRENLPFDLAHLRWPLQYNLPPDATKEAREKEKKRLTKVFKGAVLESLALVQPVITPAPAFPEAVAKDGPARFRAAGDALGFDEDVLGGREVFLTSGPAMWMRLMPVSHPQKRWSTTELLRAGLENSKLFPLREVMGGYSYVRSSDGQGIYRGRGAGETSTDAVAFAFRTGEVWSIDTTLLVADDKKLYVGDIEAVFAKAAERYRRFLKALGLEGPYRWKLGLTGVKGRRLALPLRPGYVRFDMGLPVCAADTIEAEGTLDDGQSAHDALLPFFEMIYEECGIERPKQ